MGPKYLLLGEVLRPHGIRGELRMRVLTDYPERIPQLQSVYLGPDNDGKNARTYQVASMRMHQGYALLTLKGIATRDEAEALRGLFVMVDIQDAVPLEDDEIYLYQLIGMQVVTSDGKSLGTVSDVLETGANDVYVIDSPDHGEILIPVLKSTILEVNTDTNIITVELPEGLIPS